MSQMIRQLLPGLRAVLVFTVLLGLAYPLLMTGIAQLAFPHQANGSLQTVDGRSVSTVLGQQFTGAEWLQPRPSEAKDAENENDPGYNGLYSAGSNLGPNSEELVTGIDQRRADVARANGVPPEQVPADAVTASSSGLDPDISPAYAELQVNRIATARGVPAATVRAAIAEGSRAPMLGFLGQPRVNVSEVNLALARG
ncbi:K+-transporting ATPase ATPase C chain [Propionibacteriaceae bacterium ES.041]|uniref:potassium-transporting ATPase subunit KdpC n=1 Tax=Enemella evansiae TaxID=2016499 RepID=UPI000B975681|nr:potassium-transporting ATPase subunit KdpC [Enemella evansiae]OYN96875.1 potassium-transporting ATPase subunit C [Enemella evansiae]PFG69027.1 K+-transporting ATPase ATPase C chain [Propionibacteriaceae bacterium ES.041]